MTEDSRRLKKIKELTNNEIGVRKVVGERLNEVIKNFNELYESFLEVVQTLDINLKATNKLIDLHCKQDQSSSDEFTDPSS